MTSRLLSLPGLHGMTDLFVVSQTIVAALLAAVESCFGPNGGDKLVVTAENKVLTTNSGQALHSHFSFKPVADLLRCCFLFL